MKLIKKIKQVARIESISRKLKSIFRVYFYKGHKIKCPVCNWHGKQYFEDRCPKCHSLPRTRLVSFSFNYFDLLKDKLKILHLAPNKAEYDFIRKHTNCILYDRMDILPYKHVNVLQDITQSDISSDTYNLVVAWHLFEHIKDDYKAIAEVYRILTKGGKALVSVPIFPKANKITYEDSLIKYEDYERVHGHFDHCRSCGLDYYKRFEEAGFQTETLMVNNLSDLEIENFGLSIDHVVWCFTK